MQEKSKCQRDHSKKHCSSLCCKVNKISTNLDNIVNYLKCKSPNNKIRSYASPQIYPQSPPSQRPVASQYFKVTETVNNINGIEQFKIRKHHTDNSEMRGVLEWDDQQETNRQRQEFNSKVIKLNFDRKKQELESLRKKSEQKPWEKQQKFNVYEDDNGANKLKGESPRFNNEYLQRKTQQIQNKHGNNDVFEKSLQKTIQNPNNTQYYKIENGKINYKSKYQKNRNNDQYSYKKKIVTRFRNEVDLSNSSTDSQFSRFQFST